MKNILEQEGSVKKINFVVDEYDRKDVDKAEANFLNKLFNGSLLKVSFILLILQPIEKDQIINNTCQSKDKFDLVKEMKQYQLKLVMRNSVEIHSHIKVPMDLLQKQKTVLSCQKTNKTES